MAEREEDKQPAPIDEETLQSIQDTLYSRLREPLLLEIRERLMEQAAEQPIPLYFDRYIAGETQRLEEAIDRNTQRLMDLRREMNLRFGEIDRRLTEAREEREALRVEMDRRFEEMDRRFTEAREEREALRAEMDRRFAEQQQWLERRFAEQQQWLEHRFAEQQQGLGHRFAEQKEGLDWRFEAINQRFETVDQRFDAVDQRFDAVDRRLDAVDRRLDAVDRRLQALDTKIDQQNVHMRNWVLAAVAIMSVIVAILQLVLR